MILIKGILYLLVPWGNLPKHEKTGAVTNQEVELKMQISWESESEMLTASEVGSQLPQTRQGKC